MDNRFTRFRISIAALLLALCSGCSQTEQEDGTSAAGGTGGAVDSQPVALRIGGVSAGAVVTRSQNTLLNDPGDKIGLFLQGSDHYDAISNREFTYATPFWTSDDGLVMLTDQPAALAATYPYRDGQPTLQDLRTQEYDSRDDFLYCRFAANKRDASVVLNMTRAYARLCFRLRPQTGDNAYTGEGVIDEFRFTASGIVLRAQLNLFSGVLTSEEPQADYTFVSVKNRGKKFTANTPLEVSFLAVPAVLTGDITVEAVIDGKRVSAGVSATRLCGVTGRMVPGTSYDINIVMNPSGMTLGQVSTQQWTEFPVRGAGGDYEME